jgi:uncharacterized protein YidB (DUF937 family)
MGLLEQVIGSVVGSRMGGGLGGGLGGAPGRSGGQGGMSPIMMALMALLASRSMGGGSGGMGGLGGSMGGLGGLLGGALGGGALGGGLGGLLERFQNSGRGDIADSWVGHGENRPISPHELGDTLGDDTVETLSRETGMPRGDLLSHLSEVLPGVVDKLTPQGRRPDDHEMSSW